MVAREERLPSTVHESHICIQWALSPEEFGGLALLRSRRMRCFKRRKGVNANGAEELEGEKSEEEEEEEKVPSRHPFEQRRR